MAIELTPEQENLIAENKKPDADLPVYFSAALNREIPISRDFEAFLILSDSEILQEANKWIQIVSNTYTRKTDHDDLLTKFITNDAGDANAKIDELNTTLLDFNIFRGQFITSSTFNGITEVGMILSDYQRALGELTVTQDRYNHLIILINILKARLEKENTGDKNLRQLESWSESFNAY